MKVLQFKHILPSLALLTTRRTVCAMAIMNQNPKAALITGSTDGIGLTTAKQLASKGYNTIIHGRNPERIKRAVEIVQEFSNVPKESIFTVESDISTVQGCKTLSHKVQSILKENNLSLDILMNNAGVFEPKHVLTEDNLEMTFAVNVMAPFVITSSLLPELLSKDGVHRRIVIASSISQCRSIDHWDDLHCMSRQYSTHRAYSESKLFDAMLSSEFATLLTEAGFGTDRITCNSLDPGTVITKMLLAGWGPCGIDVDSALDETWLCTSEDAKDTSGAYFCWKSVSREADGYKRSERKRMWDVLSAIHPESAASWGNIHSFL